MEKNAPEEDGQGGASEAGGRLKFGRHGGSAWLLNHSRLFFLLKWSVEFSRVAPGQSNFSHTNKIRCEWLDQWRKPFKLQSGSSLAVESRRLTLTLSDKPGKRLIAAEV